MIIAFQQTKDVLLEGFGLTRDAMHIHIGLAAFFALHLVLRRRLGHLIPLAILLGICLTGELLDMAYIARDGHDPRWAMSAIDVANTMFWPLVLTICGRWFGPRQSAGVDGSA